jgi:hypothetical protein
MESRPCDDAGRAVEARESRSEVVVVRTFEPGWASRQALWRSYEALLPIHRRSAKALKPSALAASVEEQLEVEHA